MVSVWLAAGRAHKKQAQKHASRAAPVPAPLLNAGFSLLGPQHATQLVWERMKLLIEPTAAVGVAAVLGRQFQEVVPAARDICVVLSGGNVDLRALSWLKGSECEGAHRPLSC